MPDEKANPVPEEDEGLELEMVEETYQIKGGSNRAKAVGLGTPNAMPARRTDEKQLSIHLGAVFLKHPELRPVTTSECLVSIRKDSKGDPCLMIALQMSQAKSKSRISSSTAETPESQPEKDETTG